MVVHIYERMLYNHVSEVDAGHARTGPANKGRQTTIVIAPQRRLSPDKKLSCAIDIDRRICENQTLIFRLAFADSHLVVCGPPLGLLFRCGGSTCTEGGCGVSRRQSTPHKSEEPGSRTEREAPPMEPPFTSTLLQWRRTPEPR